MRILIQNGTIVNRGESFKGNILINNNIIEKIIPLEDIEATNNLHPDKIIDANGLHILPGVIDDQVHFREPGGTTKATIESESRAAVLGGVTSFMDMPNNNPPATTAKALEEKMTISGRDSYANYSFYLGATNENIEEIVNVDKNRVCGVKVFMGSSTGNMLVNSEETLNAIFKESPILIATHCEQEEIIKRNMQLYTEKYGEEIPFEAHPSIRSREACIECTKRALELAVKNKSRLHILHISTADEIELIREAQKVNPLISGEVCVHYLWFNKNDYAKYGSKIKCNPAIKEESDMLALRKAVKEGVIKVIATDHAPHLKSEKENNYTKAPSGLPLVQHSLLLMLELAHKGVFTLEEVVDRMSHSPAECFNINMRGYVEPGYFADLVMVDLNKPHTITPEEPAYKCAWSPLEGETFSSSVVHTFVNGVMVVNDGEITGEKRAESLLFTRL